MKKDLIERKEKRKEKETKERNRIEKKEGERCQANACTTTRGVAMGRESSR